MAEQVNVQPCPQTVVSEQSSGALPLASTEGIAVIDKFLEASRHI